jgi:hypothetical protein
VTGSSSAGGTDLDAGAALTFAVKGASNSVSVSVRPMDLKRVAFMAGASLKYYSEFGMERILETAQARGGRAVRRWRLVVARLYHRHHFL